MKKVQITQLFSDVNDSYYGFKRWFKPKVFAYIVLKDNSLLYIGDRDMWYFDDTDGILYVASALLNTTTGELQMPTTGVTNQSNVDRMHNIIDFDNINHIVLNFQGQYLGGGR